MGALNAPLGCWAVRADDVNVEVAHGASELREPIARFNRG
jgi:hypothetical protein